MNVHLRIEQMASGRWAITDGGTILAEFETNAQAWRWLDNHERRELWSRGSSAERHGAIYYDV